jgi:hypothetical protein
MRRISPPPFSLAKVSELRKAVSSLRYVEPHPSIHRFATLRMLLSLGRIVVASSPLRGEDKRRGRLAFSSPSPSSPPLKGGETAGVIGRRWG